MPNNHFENIYIHQNFNKNQIQSVLLENATYSTRPEPTNGSDKGLLYFDTEINRILVWNGGEWKIVRYFDDRDLTNSQDIQIRDIWADSGAVSTLSEDEAKGLTGSQVVVQYYEDRPTAHIPGSWSYFTNEMRNVIFPRNFTDGGASYSEFYLPIVKCQPVGTVIDPSEYLINEYKINNGSEVQYRIEFKDGRRMNNLGVSPASPPTISFYKYVGERLSLSYINGSVSKTEFVGTDFTTDPNNSDRVRRNLTGTGIQAIGDIQMLTVNGQEISANTHYIVYEETNVYYLSIDISVNGTNWFDEGGLDVNDLIYLTTESVG